ncbi:LytR/AlgR family response regulator transcription factor [Aquimarina litoralis]|uniref:LytR/AlgR family response regulator transcription factor n=1 Tax=Aquimarina litoralis TaxID=584605 RepID=UPI001C586EE2|nr:LytTR family DNA-binding domain-containing protein [Aquimarina litoralis]MBW1296658.1 hypothetical protein [Aquimarina litoralis]
MFKLLYTPFPKPKMTIKNVIWVFLTGFLGSVFVILFKPFNITNQTGVWYFNLIAMSMGVVFSFSIFFMEFLIPKLFRKFFKKWNIGKALLWYSLVILFVGAAMFLYKSFLGGFRDFTFNEYIMVIGRVLGIGVIVSFFVVGIFSYFNRQSIASISSKELYRITSANSKPLDINLNEILYIVSDDNYVDIHKVENGKRKKVVFRSSLKNIEDQIVNPISPMYRCHRRYLVNINSFTIKNDKRRNTIIKLKDFEDEIPVSEKYYTIIVNLLQINP